ncbi:hypothetical protein COCSADRAFT_271785 [Bipolaris sorokiniana ND90Pr]|nr:uncharacterized protein COCSADRAFT_271785 [Bipolaris sorokiniana ND90Pr]EMD68344.1 hypothetical protein COCSADRAFT_271785 [Bipolaris sorokiniana ND90Pr]
MIAGLSVDMRIDRSCLSGRVRSARCSGGVEKGHVRDRRRRCRNRDAVARFEARRLVRICYVLESVKNECNWRRIMGVFALSFTGIVGLV